MLDQHKFLYINYIVFLKFLKTVFSSRLGFYILCWLFLFMKLKFVGEKMLNSGSKQIEVLKKSEAEFEIGKK